MTPSRFPGRRDDGPGLEQELTSTAGRVLRVA
jgi:hypothetical protein